ncbi:MAG: DMT family transporter, partial [Sciscionella sp.]
VLLSVEGVAPLHGNPDQPRLMLAGLAAAVVVGLLVTVARRRHALAHSVLVASAAGLCYATSAALMKLTTDDLIYRGVVATAMDWPGYVLAASTLCGLLLGQEAYASGSLPAAIAAMSIVNPTASYVLGVFAFHTVVPLEPDVLAAMSGAGLLLFAGAVGLAHSPTVHQETARAARYGTNLDDATVAATDS